MAVTKQVEKISDLLAPTVIALGYELWGIEYISQGKDSVLRIFIDSDQGITVDDCAKVSHQISGILDVEDPIQGEYTLELSSPGLDRPLFYLPQYESYIGHKVHIRLAVAENNRRKFAGILTGIKNDIIAVEVDGQVYELGYGNIIKAQVEIP